MPSRAPIRLRPSPALVIASIALAISLGGTGYAAFKLPKGSVGSPQLRRGAVTSIKVRNRSLLAVDFKRGQLPAAAPAGLKGEKGDKGEKGEKGDPGPGGPAGSQGAPGLSGLEWVETAGGGSLTKKTVDAKCPPGKKVVGGGYQLSGNAAGIGVEVVDFPWSDLTFWRAIGTWPKGVFPTAWQLVVYAVCARVTS
jgi:hypothetical protein